MTWNYNYNQKLWIWSSLHSLDITTYFYRSQPIYRHIHILASSRCCFQGKHERIHSDIRCSWSLPQYSCNLGMMAEQCSLVDTLDWGMCLLFYHRQDHIYIHNTATYKLLCWSMGILETHPQMKLPNTKHKPQTHVSVGNWFLILLILKIFHYNTVTKKRIYHFEQATI